MDPAWTAHPPPMVGGALPLVLPNHPPSTTFAGAPNGGVAGTTPRGLHGEGENGAGPAITTTPRIATNATPSTAAANGMGGSALLASSRPKIIMSVTPRTSVESSHPNSAASPAAAVAGHAAVGTHTATTLLPTQKSLPVLLPATVGTGARVTPQSPGDDGKDFGKVWDGKRDIEVGDLVIAMPSRESQADFWYRAKVVREKDGQVLLHYLGWNTRHDEWMSRDAHRIAAVKYLESEENAAAASAAAASAGESNDSNDWDNSKADTHAVLPPGACEAVDNGYLRLRSDGTYDAFVCVPFDAVCGDGDEDGETPALAALLRDDRRVFIGNFRNRKLGARALSDERQLADAYRAVLSTNPASRIPAACTDCGAAVSVCASKVPTDPLWACVACDGAKGDLASVLGTRSGHVQGSDGGGASNRAAGLDTARIESDWLRFHAHETESLRIAKQRISTMKELASELVAEQSAQSSTYVDAESRRVSAERRMWELSNKKARLLSLVGRIHRADALLAQRQAAAAATAATTAQAVAQAAAAAAATHQAAMQATAQRAQTSSAPESVRLPVRLPTLVYASPPQIAESVSVGKDAVMTTYALQPAAIVVDSSSSAVTAAPTYAPTLPALLPTSTQTSAASDMDIDLTPVFSLCSSGGSAGGPYLPHLTAEAPPATTAVNGSTLNHPQ